MKNLVAAIVWTQLVVQSPGNPPREVVPIKVDRNKTMVSVKVGNVLVPDIVLDTGFTFEGLMIYSSEYLGGADLEGAASVRIGGAGEGEASRASLLSLSSFSLGEIKLTGQRILVLQDNTFSGFSSKGIIGYSIFGNYVTELDFDVGEMTLHDPRDFTPGEGWEQLPLYFKQNTIPWVDVALAVSDETLTPVSTYIDFAAGDAIVLLERPDMEFPLPAETKEIYIGRGLSGDIYGKSGRITRLQIGPFALKNVPASIADAEVRSKQEGADAVLGCGSLRRFNIIFDYPSKKLYLRPNSSFREAFE